MLRRAILLAVLFVLLSCQVAFGWTGKVVRIIDGDTIVVQDGDCDNPKLTR